MTVRKIKSIGDIPYPIDVGTDALSPLLTAGAALGITGNTTDSAAWLQRVSASDGAAAIRSIHGRTLRWNQLAQYGHMASNGSTVTTSGNTATVTSTITSGSYFGVAIVPSTRHAAANGHKYYVAADVDMTGITDQALSKVTVSFGSLTATFVGTDSLTASGRIACIATINATGTGGSTYINALFSSAHDTSGQSFAVTNAMVMDLTVMFGAGSEPSTVSEFEALYSQPYYEYDAGSLLPVNMTGIESTAADESWTQQRTIPAGALRSAGSVYDEQTETERITRVSEITIPESVTFSDVNDGTYYLSLSYDATKMPNNDGNTVAPLETALPYDVVARSHITDRDKTISGHLAGSLYYIRVHDSSITTVDAFRQLMVGQLFHLGVTTPTVTPHEQPLNLTYRTEHGGTERVMVPTGELSAPPTLVTAQGYTAESLRDAALSAIAPVENGLASTNYGVGSYLVHGGQLCKVTTAIATGEAITIGTNVTATTVMAEILSLVQ